MKQWMVLSALLLVSLNVWVTLGNVMHCADDTDCPENNCCLAVAEEYICSPFSKQNETCQLERIVPTPSEDDSRTHVGSCPCAAGLICSSNPSSSSSSEESDSHSTEQAICRNVRADSSESEE
ncbi:hypothetical protein C0J52_05572 [Blattella germanica]|nr:hypothetical protein C0J52_05572 [Blattella germanica]